MSTDSTLLSGHLSHRVHCTHYRVEKGGQLSVSWTFSGNTTVFSSSVTVEVGIFITNPGTVLLILLKGLQ